MMLYEAIHYQVNDRFSDANYKFTERKTIPKTSSATNVERFANRQKDFARTCSYVVGQKLRESKWFAHEEEKILCAVVETGFIVERKTEGEENVYGVAVWTPGYEKSKDPEQISIYSIIVHKGTPRVHSYPLNEFWPLGTLLRINNHADKSDTPHAEDIIRNQITYAINKKSKWHNSEHFTYWCRYGTPQASENVKGINFGRYSGFAMLKRIRRTSSK